MIFNMVYFKVKIKDYYGFCEIFFYYVKDLFLWLDLNIWVGIFFYMWFEVML